MRQELIADAAGTLRHTPAVKGRPASAAVTLYKPSGAELAASAAATLHTTDTVLNADAAAGDASVVVDSVGGITVGETYWLENAYGQSEQARAVKVDSNTGVVTLEEPLSYDHQDGVSTFYANSMSVAVASGDTAIRDRGYYAKWVYTVDGEEQIAREAFDIVRQRWPSVILSPKRFKEIVGHEMSASVMEDPDTDGEDFRIEIAEATRRVKDKIRRRDAELDLFLTYSEFERPIAEMVLLTWAERGFVAQGFDDAGEFYEHQSGLLESALDEALDNVDTFDADDSGAVDETERTARPAPVRFHL